MTNHKKSKSRGFVRVLLYNAILWFGLVMVVYVLLNWSFVLAYLEYYWQNKMDLQPQVSGTSVPSPILEHGLIECGYSKLSPNTLYIPAIWALAPIQYPLSLADSDVQTALQTGVVHYLYTAMPGQMGNMYLMGHSSDWWRVPGNFKTVFALLPQLAIDDWVFVSGPDGNAYGYQVVDKFVVSPNDTWVLSQNATEPILTLQTSYPLGTALKRYIVQARLSCDSK